MPEPSAAIQSGVYPDYQLHTLGWKSFQDLCGTIVGEVFGQDARSFPPGRDGGRDGAWRGTWKPAEGAPTFNGAFSFQVKFTADSNRFLRLGDITAELPKIAKLAEQGLCDNYFLLTNAKILADDQARIEAAIGAIRSVQNAIVFDVTWIVAKLRESPRLRALVPRVYGLGDLKSIFDQAELEQSKAIIDTLGSDLRKLVKTTTHERAARALLDRGFVVLLGRPAVAKSIIAASLALAALDVWRAPTTVARTVDDIVDNWRVDEPRHFFWLDDAFGTTQFRFDLAENWNRAARHLRTAIERGARIVITSRSHIFLQAQGYVKKWDFPLLFESQVHVEVERLTRDERRQILYNHVKFGDIDQSTKRALRPHLSALADHPEFSPETARRLGSKTFTNALSIDDKSLATFFAHPLHQAIEVITTLDRDSFAALGAIFSVGGRLASPLKFSAELSNAITLLGSEERRIPGALTALNDSLVRYSGLGPTPYWAFRHPTVRDAVAEVIAISPDLVQIYLSGVPIERIAEEVVCGNIQLQGARIRVPHAEYETLMARVALLPPSEAAAFLAARADADFIELALTRYPGLFDSELRTRRRGTAFSAVLSAFRRANEFGVLGEAHRAQIAEKIIGLATDEDEPDISILCDENYRSLLEVTEVRGIEDFLRSDYIPRLNQLIEDLRYNWSDDDDPDEHFSDFIENLEFLPKALTLTATEEAQFKSALMYAEDELDEMREEYKPKEGVDPDFDALYDRDAGGGGFSASGGIVDLPRDMFDDVAD